MEPGYACGTQIRITFIEASPDIFVVEFLDGPEREISALRFDLSQSRGGAFVDTAYGGSPSGHRTQCYWNGLRFHNRNQTGQVTFRSFPAGNSFNLLVDLDDNAVGGDENRNVLDGRELEGGEVARRPATIAGAPTNCEEHSTTRALHWIGNLACS